MEAYELTLFARIAVQAHQIQYRGTKMEGFRSFSKKMEETEHKITRLQGYKIANAE
jgi:hypothetical protein